MKEDKPGWQKAEPVVAKGLEISEFGIVEYSVRSESRRMIAVWY